MKRNDPQTLPPLLRTFPLEALLSEDADEREELCHLFQIKHRGVVELDDGQRLLVVGAAAAVLHQPGGMGEEGVITGRDGETSLSLMT